MLQNALSTFHPSAATTAADGGGGSEKARGGCDPEAGAPCPLFFPHKCERHKDVGRNHLSQFIQPLLLPVPRPIHSRCFGRNSNGAAGFAGVDAFWRQTHSWLALPPRCICDPVASSCAVFDERCCPARPDSACCAASRAAPLAHLHWPLPLGQRQGWLGAYLRGNVGQVPSPPSPDGSLPSGEPEVRKPARVDGVLLVLPLIVLEASGRLPGWRVTSRRSRLVPPVRLIAPAPSRNMLAYPDKMKNQYVSPVSHIFAGQLTLTP